MLLFHVLFDRLGLPLAHAVEQRGQNSAENPGQKQGNLDTFLLTVGQFSRSGQERNTVGNGNTDGDCRDQGDPHRSHGVARAAHDTGKALRDSNGNVADGKDHHQTVAQVNQFNRIGEDVHQRLAEEQDDARDNGRSTNRHQRTLLCALDNAVILTCADVLTGKGGQRHTEGEVRHHGKTVDTHDNDVCGNELLAEAVGQRLDDDHGRGEDRLCKP